MIPIILVLLVIALLSPHYRSHQARMEAIKQMHRASQDDLEKKYRKMVPYGNVRVDKSSGRVRVNPTRATMIVYGLRRVKHWVKKHPLHVVGMVGVGIILLHFSGLPLFPIIGVNRYWVGGNGNISDNTNHWSSSSGGSPGASKPSNGDNVYFDTSSGTPTVTMDEDGANWATFAVQDDCTFQDNGSTKKISCFSSFLVSTGKTITINDNGGDARLRLYSTGLTAFLNLGTITGTGTFWWDLQTTDQTVSTNCGTMTTADFLITATAITANPTTLTLPGPNKTLGGNLQVRNEMTDGKDLQVKVPTNTLIVSGDITHYTNSVLEKITWQDAGSGAILSVGGSPDFDVGDASVAISASFLIIKMTGAGETITSTTYCTYSILRIDPGGGNTVNHVGASNNLTIDLDTGTLSKTDATTLDLAISGGSSTFANGTTLYLRNCTTDTGGADHHFTYNASATYDITDCTIGDINSIGGTIEVFDCTDDGGTTNITFSASTTDRYWIGGSGNVNDTAHWSTSSGGAGGSSVPADAAPVFVDGNSGSPTITLNADTNNWGDTDMSAGNGTIQADGSARTLKCQGALNLSDMSVNDTDLTVQMNGSGKTMTTGSTFSIKTLDINDNTTFSSSNNISVSSDLDIATGKTVTLAISTNSLNISNGAIDNWNNTGETVTGTGVLTFRVSTATGRTLDNIGTITCTSIEFVAMNFDLARAITLGEAVTFTVPVSIINKHATNSFTFQINGNLTVNSTLTDSDTGGGITFQTDGSARTLTTNDTLDIAESTISDSNLKILMNGSGKTLKLLANSTVGEIEIDSAGTITLDEGGTPSQINAGTITITTGTLDCDGHNLVVNDWYCAGTFTAQTATVTIIPNTTANVEISGSCEFYNLQLGTLAMSGTRTTVFKQSTTITNDFTDSSGGADLVLSADGSPITLSVGGDVTLDETTVDDTDLTFQMSKTGGVLTLPNLSNIGGLDIDDDTTIAEGLIIWTSLEVFTGKTLTLTGGKLYIVANEAIENINNLGTITESGSILEFDISVRAGGTGSYTLTGLGTITVSLVKFHCYDSTQSNEIIVGEATTIASPLQFREATGAQSLTIQLDANLTVSGAISDVDSGGGITLQTDGTDRTLTSSDDATLDATAISDSNLSIQMTGSEKTLTSKSGNTIGTLDINDDTTITCNEFKIATGLDIADNKTLTISDGDRVELRNAGIDGTVFGTGASITGGTLAVRLTDTTNRALDVATIDTDLHCYCGTGGDNTLRLGPNVPLTVNGSATFDQSGGGKFTIQIEDSITINGALDGSEDEDDLIFQADGSARTMTCSDSIDFRDMTCTDHNFTLIASGDSKTISTGNHYDGNVQIGTSPGTILLSEDLYCHDLTISSGDTLEANGYDIYLTGDWLDQGQFMHDSGTVTFQSTGSAKQQITLGSFPFWDVIVDCSDASGGVDIQDDFANDGTFTVTDGTFLGNANGIEHGGLDVDTNGVYSATSTVMSLTSDLNVLGSFIHNNGKIVVNDDCSMTVTTVYDLELDAIGKDLVLNSNITIENSLYLVNGDASLSAGITVTIGAGKTVTLEAGTYFYLHGSLGSRAVMVSSTPGTQYIFTGASADQFQPVYLDVTDCDASALPTAIDARDGTSVGATQNNDNWLFADPSEDYEFWGILPAIIEPVEEVIT